MADSNVALSDADRRRTIDELSGRSAAESCWQWQGRLNRDGYGQISWYINHQRCTFVAHRLVYEMLVGPIEVGLEIDHLCRNRSCCNPAHLEPVTHAENIRRFEEALGIGRYATQCRNGHEFTTSNTYIRPSGHRDCRKCVSIRQMRYQCRRRHESLKAAA